MRGDGVSGAGTATFPVKFLRGMLGRGNRPKNPWYFGGDGEVSFDEASFRVKGKHAEVLWGGEFKEHAFPLSSLRNASCEGTKLRVEIFDTDASRRGREVVFWASDENAASEIFARLPKVQTEEYATRTREKAEFDARLEANTPRVYVTYALMAITAAVMAGAYLGRGDVVGHWVASAGLTGGAARAARLLVSVFMPSALPTCIVGILTLHAIGRTAERAYGNGTFLFLYLLAGVAGSIASAQWNGSLGASTSSGAFFGLVGAYLAYGLKGANLVPATVVGEFKVAGYFLLGMNVLAGIFGKTDYAAGAAAFIAGFASGYALGKPLEAPGRQAQGGTRT